MFSKSFFQFDDKRLTKSVCSTYESSLEVICQQVRAVTVYLRRPTSLSHFTTSHCYEIYIFLGRKDMRVWRAFSLADIITCNQRGSFIKLSTIVSWRTKSSRTRLAEPLVLCGRNYARESRRERTWYSCMYLFISDSFVEKMFNCNYWVDQTMRMDYRELELQVLFCWFAKKVEWQQFCCQSPMNADSQVIHDQKQHTCDEFYNDYTSSESEKIWQSNTSNITLGFTCFYCTWSFMYWHNFFVTHLLRKYNFFDPR